MEIIQGITKHSRYDNYVKCFLTCPIRLNDKFGLTIENFAFELELCNNYTLKDVIHIGNRWEHSWKPLEFERSILYA